MNAGQTGMFDATHILNASILIVDDKQANVLLLERMLHGAGYTCVTSTLDPRAVYELHREHRYNLILLDLQMPGMDGFEVMTLRPARAQTAGVAVRRAGFHQQAV
jgi:CheY-like chemotaxis protein